LSDGRVMKATPGFAIIDAASLRPWLQTTNPGKWIGHWSANSDFISLSRFSPWPLGRLKCPGASMALVVNKVTSVQPDEAHSMGHQHAESRSDQEHHVGMMETVLIYRTTRRRSGCPTNASRMDSSSNNAVYCALTAARARQTNTKWCSPPHHRCHTCHMSVENGAPPRS
jgi:hypothetical protein